MHDNLEWRNTKLPVNDSEDEKGSNRPHLRKVSDSHNYSSSDIMTKTKEISTNNNSGKILQDLIWHRKDEMSHIINITATDQRNAPMTLLDYTNIINDQTSHYNTEEDKNKLKGDMFEILAAGFFNAFQNDESVGLRDYQIVAPNEDYGVDGTGINANNDKVAVQVKFRSNPKDLITYGDISKTFTSGTLQHGLDLTRPNSIYVLTNADDVTPTCQNAFGYIIRVINNDVIKGKVDNNFNFWKHFIEDLYEVLSK